MSEIRSVRRYLNRFGKQRPLLGLCVPEFDAVARAGDRDRVRRVWRRWIRSATEADFDLIGIPPSLRLASEDVAFLLRNAAAAGLGSVLSIDPRRGDVGQLQRLRAITVDMIARVGPVRHGTTDLDALETEVHTECAHLGLPVIVTARRPDGPNGIALRAAARTFDATCIEVAGDDPTDAASLVGACLAGRVEDRPAMLQIASSSPATLERAALAVAGTGLAALLTKPSPAGDEPPPSAVHAMRGLLDVREQYPDEWPEPPLESAAVLCLDPSDNPTQPFDAVLGAMLLMQRRLGTNVRLAFEDRPERGIPHVAYLPVHGPLSEDAWSWVWNLAMRGAHVILTGLTLENGATENRLQQLAVPTTTIASGESDALPPWLRGRPVLSTKGHPRAAGLESDHGGELWFLDRCPEMAPHDAMAASAIPEAVAAGIHPEAFLRDGIASVRRVVRWDDAWIDAWIETDLSAGTLRCSPPRS